MEGGCCVKQSGAVGACWAHNPEVVDGSKPSSASFFSLGILQAP